MRALPGARVIFRSAMTDSLPRPVVRSTCARTTPRHRGMVVALHDGMSTTAIANTEARIGQEVARLGGHYAHVLDESIHSERDDIAGEAWLQGPFRYVLYGRGATDRVR